MVQYSDLIAINLICRSEILVIGLPIGMVKTGFTTHLPSWQLRLDQEVIFFSKADRNDLRVHGLFACYPGLTIIFSVSKCIMI